MIDLSFIFLFMRVQKILMDKKYLLNKFKK
jgi:hypothetical protein